MEKSHIWRKLETLSGPCIYLFFFVSSAFIPFQSVQLQGSWKKLSRLHSSLPESSYLILAVCTISKISLCLMVSICEMNKPTCYSSGVCLWPGLIIRNEALRVFKLHDSWNESHPQMSLVGPQHWTPRTNATGCKAELIWTASSALPSLSEHIPQQTRPLKFLAPQYRSLPLTNLIFIFCLYKFLLYIYHKIHSKYFWIQS